MKQLTLRQRKFKSTLRKLVQINNDARKVSERYRVMRYLLQEEYPHLIGTISKDSMYEFLRDVVYIDRQIRKETEGYDSEQKEILAQEKEIELGYEPLTKLPI